MRHNSVWIVLAAALALAVPAHPDAIRDLSGFSLGALPRNDDGFIQNIGLPFDINFFGTAYNLVSVNNNGNLTFGANVGMSTYTPFGLTGNIGRAIIAPFFADVDTRNGSSGITQYGNVTVDGRQAFVANYPAVGYYPSAADKLNTFQVLLIDRSDVGGGDFDIEFNYNHVQWETGSASGGSGGLGGASARVGYSNGTGTAGTFYELPGSGVNGAFLDGGPNSLIASSFNSDVLGRYVFPVRNGAPIEPGTLPELPINPTVVVPGDDDQPPVFQFNLQPPRRWFDPPLVYGFQYDMLTAGAGFTQVEFPYGPAFGNLTLTYGSTTVTFDHTSGAPGGDIYTFLSPVTSFTVTGILPNLDAADPNFLTAFPTWLDFNVAAASFSMTPLTSEVPEPSSIVLFVTVALGSGFLVRRKQRT